MVRNSSSSLETAEPRGNSSFVAKDFTWTCMVMAMDRGHAEDKFVVKRTGYDRGGVGVTIDVKRIGKGLSASVTVPTNVGNHDDGFLCGDSMRGEAGSAPL